MRILIYIAFIHYVFGLSIPIYRRGHKPGYKAQNAKKDATMKMCEELDNLVKLLPNIPNKSVIQNSITALKNGNNYIEALDSIRNSIDNINPGELKLSTKTILDANKCLSYVSLHVKTIINQRIENFIDYNKVKNIKKDAPIETLESVATEKFNNIELDVMTNNPTTIGKIGKVSGEDIARISRVFKNGDKNVIRAPVTINGKKYSIQLSDANKNSIEAMTHIKPIKLNETLKNSISALNSKFNSCKGIDSTVNNKGPGPSGSGGSSGSGSPWGTVSKSASNNAWGTVSKSTSGNVVNSGPSSSRQHTTNNTPRAISFDNVRKVANSDTPDICRERIIANNARLDAMDAAKSITTNRNPVRPIAANMNTVRPIAVNMNPLRQITANMNKIIKITDKKKQIIKKLICYIF